MTWIIIQGATRIPPSGCGIAAGYGSCICLRSVIFLVLCWLLGCYAMSLLTNSFESSGCLLSGRFGGREYWYRRRENDDRIIVKLSRNCLKMIPTCIEIVSKCMKMVSKWIRNGAWGVPRGSGEAMVGSRTLLERFWINFEAFWE